MSTFTMRVTIDDYEPNDRYQVNVYKVGSQIPVQTKDIAVGGGDTVYFTLLDNTLNYDAEVVHLCDNLGTTKKTRKQVFESDPSGCNCQPGWARNQDNTKCTRTTTQATSTVGSAFYVGAGPNSNTYNRYGIKVYGIGYQQNGQGGVIYASGANHLYWSSRETFNNGRLNIAGVWNLGDAINPIAVWIGFSTKITAITSKLYYMGVAGDDYVRIKLNGVVIVDQKMVGGATNGNFNYWHCYPIVLNAGDNIIEVQGWNNEQQGCFAAEIYDCELQAIQLVTPATENTLHRIWSTLDMIGGIFTNAYACATGYALDISNPAIPVCKKIEYIDCT